MVQIILYLNVRLSHTNVSLNYLIINKKINTIYPLYETIRETRLDKEKEKLGRRCTTTLALWDKRRKRVNM